MQIKRLFKEPSSIGVIFGTVLLAVSVTPSLIPRSTVQQAIISALSFLCGYGIGVGLNALWRYVELPTIPQKYRKRSTQLALTLCGIILFYFLYKASGWQNDVRQMVGQEPVDSAYPVRMALLAVIIVVLLLLLFRILLWLAQAVMRVVTKFIPYRVGQVIGIAIAVWLIVSLVNGVLIQTVSDALNSTYALKDGSNYDNVEQPTSALRSGSPESLAEWETFSSRLIP